MTSAGKGEQGHLAAVNTVDRWVTINRGSRADGWEVSLLELHFIQDDDASIAPDR